MHYMNVVTPISVAAGFINGSSFTITGSGFGTKSRALSPILRDVGAAATGTLDAQWSGGYPNAATTDTNFNIQNQTAGFQPTPTAIGTPHPYVPRIIAGCHGDHTDGGNTNENVGAWGGFSIPTLPYVLYSSLYHRASPDWEFGIFVGGVNGDNYKTYSYNGMGDIYGGSSNEYAYLNFAGVAKDNATSTYQFVYDAPHPPGGWQNPDLNGENAFRQFVPAPWYPGNGWIKEEIEILVTTDATLGGGGRMDGWYSSLTAGRDCSQNIFQKNAQINYRGWTDGGPAGGSPYTGTTRYWQIGGYSVDYGNRTGTNGGGTTAYNYRFFADIYFDITGTVSPGASVARVLVGNNPSYTACTVREPQIITAWADGSITFTFWKGALQTGSIGYVHVVTESGTILSNVASALVN